MDARTFSAILPKFDASVWAAALTPALKAGVISTPRLVPASVGDGRPRSAGVGLASVWLCLGIISRGIDLYERVQDIRRGEGEAAPEFGACFPGRRD